MIIKVALLLFLKHAWEYCESNEYDEHYEKVSGKKLQYVRNLRHSSNTFRTSGILILTIPEVEYGVVEHFGITEPVGNTWNH